MLRLSRRVFFFTTAALATIGCGEGKAPAPGAASRQTMTARNREDTFRYAANLLNSLEGLDSDPAIKGNQTADVAAKKLVYGNVPPAMVEQLNRWIGTQQPSPDWKPDPLIETLPESLRDSSAAKNLAAMRFAASDGATLREVVWLRELSNWICGDVADSLARAERLFDWTVRNTQLESEVDAEPKIPRKPCLPWHLLALGRGSAVDRAWLFTLLARQQGLEVVVLEPSQPMQVVLLGLLLDNQLHLFDAQLGQPLPGAEGKGIATLKQLAEHDDLLRQLDLDDERRYPLSAADLTDLTARIEGSPVYLQQRTALIEKKLTGDQKLVLSAEPSALAKRLKAVAGIGKAELWTLPYERRRELADRKSEGVARMVKEFEPFVIPFPHRRQKQIEVIAMLWKGRVQHLLGNFTGDNGANHYYQLSRPADAALEAEFAGQLAGVQGIQDAEAKAEFSKMIQTAKDLARATKQDASYWLGLVAYERGNYTTAVDYFQVRTLEASPDGPWTAGARYNLGRALEALGKRTAAIEAYRSDDSPQRHGALLRARRLEASADKTSSESAAKN